MFGWVFELVIVCLIDWVLSWVFAPEWILCVRVDAAFDSRNWIELQNERRQVPSRNGNLQRTHYHQRLSDGDK